MLIFVGIIFNKWFLDKNKKSCVTSMILESDFYIAMLSINNWNHRTRIILSVAKENSNNYRKENDTSNEKERGK